MGIRPLGPPPIPFPRNSGLLCQLGIAFKPRERNSEKSRSELFSNHLFRRRKVAERKAPRVTQRRIKGRTRFNLIEKLVPEGCSQLIWLCKEYELHVRLVSLKQYYLRP